MDVPTPALVGVDERGHACDVPAVLMTRLPGRVELAPSDEDAWLRELAAPLARIHASDPGPVTRRYRPWYDLARRTPPDWSRERTAWAEAIRALREPPPPARECLIHRDYHPTNALFRDGRLTAVLDWVNTCRGPAAMDVAHCRLNLVSLRGVEVADRFGAHCAALDPAFEPHPYWDALDLLEILPGPFAPYPGWSDLGSAPTLGEMRERLDRYVCTLVDRLAGGEEKGW